LNDIPVCRSTLGVEKASPKTSTNSSANAPIFRRSFCFFFFDLVAGAWPFPRLGEALRELVCDWSLSLASENCSSSPNRNPVFATTGVFADAASTWGKVGAMLPCRDCRKEDDANAKVGCTSKKVRAKDRQKIYPAHVICPSVCIIEYQCCVASCALSSTPTSAF
jgi:hypothetical protein